MGLAAFPMMHSAGTVDQWPKNVACAVMYGNMWSIPVSDEMMRGVVSLPHGWGHGFDGVRLAVAREHPGVNSNHLVPGHLVDRISGNAVVNGIPVEVVPA